MARVIMTSEELVQRLKVLAARNTFYKNKYPYNLCYINSDGRTSADCVNLYKAVLNGLDVNNLSIGYFQRDLSNTGDCTEYGLLKQCSDISSDFTKLQPGFPRILYMSGHIGGYIGEEVVRGGHIYNVIECTGAWERGILYSWVDTDGTRRRWKGGSVSGKWTKHGLMTPWVKYTINSAPSNPSAKKSNTEIAIEVWEGKWGNGVDRKSRLIAAGYDYNAIQKIVNDMSNKSQEVWYTVKSGDTASGICAKNGVSLSSVKRLNPTVKNWNLIYPGQKLRLK